MENSQPVKEDAQPIKPTPQNLVKTWIFDILIACLAGIIVGTAYYFFQNSNGFAPGGVGGLATITHYLTKLETETSWALLMVAFNLPIFILVSIFVNRRLGIILIIYILVQSFTAPAWELLKVPPYSAENNGADFEIVFACIATGVVSGIGFSIMFKRFGASGGTYAISALIKHFNPEKSIAWVAFVLDSSIVVLAFFSYGSGMNPVISTLLNIFISNIVVDYMLQGLRSGYKFEIITDKPEEIAAELMAKLGRGVTALHAQGMYTHHDKTLLVCIIRKRQIGEFLKVLKRYDATFSYSCKVNEVYGRFAPIPDSLKKKK